MHNHSLVKGQWGQWARWVRWGWWPATLRVLFLLAVVLSVLPNGSVAVGSYYLSTLVHGALFALAVTVPWKNRHDRRIYDVLLVLMVLLGAYTALQSLRVEGNPLAHPAWSLVEDIEGYEGASISVAPGLTWQSLPALLVPLLVLANAVRLHQGDHAARGLWRRLALVGAGLAGIAVIRQELFPSADLFGTPSRVSPTGSGALTGHFYNRNNTAAFMAVSGMAVLGLAVYQTTRMRMDSVLARLPDFDYFSDRKYLLFFAYSLLFLLCTIAVFMTMSRSGTLFYLLSTGACLVWLLALSPGTVRGWKTRLWVAAAIMAAGAATFVLFAGGTISRLDEGAFDSRRWCVAGFTLRAIVDFPLFGTGFGAYREIYPMYRDPLCGVTGIWERAHNSFLEASLGLGLPFLAALLSLAVVVFQAIRRGLRGRQRMRHVPILFIGAVIYMLLHSMVDFPLQIHGIAVFFAALSGCSLAICNARSRKNPVC